MLEDNMSDQNTLPYVPFRLKILPHTCGDVHKQNDKLFALPVHLLRQVFYRFIDFEILSGFVWISWIPGARGRTMCGDVWRHSATESGTYCKFAKIRGLRFSMDFIDFM
jgi:hypothetical protein